MSDLPNGWRPSTLGEVARVLDSRRIPLNARERDARRGPFPYYGANGQVGTIDDYLFEGDHILLAEDGGYFDDPNRPNATRLAANSGSITTRISCKRPRPSSSASFCTC
jgi:type I restriction enzyme S subunit